MGDQFLEWRLIVRPVERGSPGQEMVQRAAKRINVSTDIHSVGVTCLLGGNVVGRAHRQAVGGQFIVNCLLRIEQGQAEGRGP